MCSQIVGKVLKYQAAAVFRPPLKVPKIMAVMTLLYGCQKLSKEQTTESHFLRSVARRTLYRYKTIETDNDPIYIKVLWIIDKDAIGYRMFLELATFPH
jgi:hypothetical protein